MRVLHVYDHLQTGGSQTHGIALAGELIRGGHAVAVASRGGATEEVFRSAGAIVLRWPAPRRLDLPGMLVSVQRAKGLLRTWSPDVIHAHAVLPGVLFSFASRGRTPIVFTPHRSWRNVYRGTGGALLSRFVCLALRLRASAVVAISEGFRRELVSHGVPEPLCHLIRNGIDARAFDGMPSVAEEAPRLVGTIARLVHQKGIDLFIEGAAQVTSAAPDVRFVIVGDGPLRAECGRLVHRLGMDERISFLGERLDIPEVLRRMCVFVSSSRWEGMPYAVLEAMAARKAVVATRVLGNSEVIAHEQTGLLVRPQDPVDLSQAILRLLNDPALARELGEGARRCVERQYNLREMSARTADLYRQLASSQYTQTPLTGTAGD